MKQLESYEIYNTNLEQLQSFETLAEFETSLRDVIVSLDTGGVRNQSQRCHCFTRHWPSSKQTEEFHWARTEPVTSRRDAIVSLDTDKARN
ncbi:hypothetical protein RRG08_011566 [Elysia crispata]|uniref:Uncharacterized protein n=1 Tax=Elysia crispata TaxID=231223 RepID=A0AAE0XS32_9GAST|nr:hypothetical protein RRG08_011566 [Elysia crispata]